MVVMDGILEELCKLLLGLENAFKLDNNELQN